MKKLQANVAAPLYQQLCDAIKEQINSGNYKVGERIPSEEQLSEMYGISRITTRSGVEKLVEEKILIKRRGKGTYVAMPTYFESMSAGGSFTKSCLLMNAVPSTKIISISRQKPTLDISKKLGIEEDQDIICISRLRLVDDVPAILETDYFRSEFNFLLQENLENRSLLDTIRENTGITANQFEDVFDIKYANKEIAGFLKCEVSYPLLRVRQTVMVDQERIVYYNEQCIMSEIYKYSTRTVK